MVIHLVRRPVQVLLIVPLISWLAKGSSSELGIAFICFVYSVFFSLEQFLHLLHFITLTQWFQCSYFVECPSIWDSLFSYVEIHISDILGRNVTEVMFIASCQVMYNFALFIISNFHFCYLIQARSAKILYFLYLICNNKQFLWGLLWNCKYFVPHEAFSLFLYSNLYRFMISVLFCFLVNFVLLISVFKLFLIWPMRVHLSWLLCSYDMSPSLWTCLYFWPQEDVLSLSSTLSDLCPGISHFSTEPWILLVGMTSEAKIWVQVCFITVALLLFPGPLSGWNWGIYIFIHIYMQTKL